MSIQDKVETSVMNNNQLMEAFQFVQDAKESTSEMIQNLINDINYLDENKMKLENNIIRLEKSNDINADLFSPSAKNSKHSQISELNIEFQKIEDNISHKKLQLKYYENKINGLNNLSSCLGELESNYYVHSKSSDDSKNIEIDNFNRKYGINLLQAQESERKRIARDLHDSTVQSLTNIKHKTELISRLIDMDIVRAKLELQTMIRTLKSTIDEMRIIIYDLRPMSIEDLGLIATINRFISEIRTNNSVEVSLNVINNEFSVMPIINLTLFRIVQEATNNALKHSKATKINIKLQYNEEDILLVICDNGVGFDPGDFSSLEESQSKTSGFGLSIMKERIFLLSGKINIISGAQSGTEISVSVPVKQ